MMHIKAHQKFILPLLIIPLILVSIWFKNGLITGGGDEALIFHNPKRVLELSSQTWLEAGTGLPTLYWLSRTNLLSLLSFFSKELLIPTYLLEAATLFSLMLVGVVAVYFITYRFVNRLSNAQLISFISAIFYLLNPYSISQVWARGLVAQYFSFALLPLAILIFLLGLQRKKFVMVPLLVLPMYFLSAAFGVVTFVPTLWSVLLITLIVWVLINEQKNKNLFFGVIFFLTSFILWFLVSTWWLLPLIITGDKVFISYLTNTSENLGTLIGVSRNFTPDLIIRLLQRTYFFDAGFNPVIYSSLAFQLISLISPIFLTTGLILIFKKKVFKEFILFLVLFTIGILVSLGANPPLGDLFVWVFKHIPFLQSFRNPYEKFGLVYSLAYCPIFAFGLVHFLDLKVRIKWIRVVIFSLLIFLICGVYAWPMWIGRVVAGPDRNVGIPIPSYYSDLQLWLNKNGDDYRILMTPLWGGEGAFYNWSGTRYQGVDPMVFILNKPAVSAGFQIPFYYDYILNMRRYMERVDLAPSLGLLRVKYLVNRGDAIMLTESEKLHQKFLTEAIYPPLGAQSISESLCSNLSANSLQSGTAWVICKLSNLEGDWNKIKYIHLNVKTFTPAYMEIAVSDQKGVRIRWDGRTVSEYRTDNNDWSEIILPLSAPSEYNSDIDFSKIDKIEVLAHPKDNQQASVYEISLKGIKLDPGRKEGTNEFQLVNTLGNLQVYEPLHLVAPPEFGILSSISQVSDFPQLFEQAYKDRDVIDKKGFILASQNPQKDLAGLKGKNFLEIVEKEKISDTKYWLKLNEVSKEGLILLSKNFNPQWKIIPGVSRVELRDGFFNDLTLLKQVVLSEDSHFVVNGYANLWKTGGDSEYAIIFMPQVVVGLGEKISKFTILIIVGLIVVWLFKRLIYDKPN